MSNSTTKRSPRAMPMETIITRYKSQRQQKNNDNKGLKNDTKSKSIPKPEEHDDWKRKQMKPLKKDSNVIVLDDDSEFYPDNPKRNIKYKKVVLKPKHSMKMIGGMKSSNKRKLHMPQKDIKRTRQNSQSSTSSDIDPCSPKHKEQSSELSIKDMVLLIEEDGGLDDEELLEILTCPSPVWWEDPPNGYIEDPIFARSKPDERKSIKNQLLEEQGKETERRKQREKELTLKSKDSENLDVSKLGINVDNHGINFVNKRCKLESLLENIRNKIKNDSDRNKGDKNIVTNGLNEKNNEKCGNNSASNTNNISESKPKDVEKNIVISLNKKIYCKTNEKQKVESKEKQCKRNVSNSTNDLSASLKPKIPKNRRKKGRNKRKVAVIKLKDDVKRDEILDDDIKTNTNVETKSKVDINSDENNIQYISNVQNDNIDLKEQGNKETSSSNESFEEDHLLDLADHEILSLENIEIPVAPEITKQNCKKVGVEIQKKISDERTTTDVSSTKKIDYESTTNDVSSTKINNTIFYDDLISKPFSYNTKNKIKCREKEIKKNISDEITRYNDDTSRDKSTNNRVQEIDTTSKQIIDKVSYVRVRKCDTYKSLTNSTSDVILGKNAPNNIYNIKNSSANENKSMHAGNKNDIRLNNTTSKIEEPSNFKNNNVRPSDKTEISNFVSKIKNACIINTEITTVNLRKTKDTKSSVICNNNRLKNINDSSATVVCTISSDTTSNKACNEIEEKIEDLSKIVNTSVPNENIISDNLSQNYATFVKITNKISDNHDQGNNIDVICENKVENDNTRRYSIDSEISDKNMSVEYLDMSLLDEDEHKIEQVSHNNEVNYECDNETQDDKQSNNKNSHINFRSDLDMSDSNMYNQINESCNNDKIRSIRNNNKDKDNIDITDNERFNADCMMSENFRTSSPIHQKEGTLNERALEKDNLDNKQQSEYITIYKIVNSDSENECTLLKSNDVKESVVNENNDVNSMKINEIEDSYDVEYLTEFDEIDIIGNENNEGNTNKINEVKNATVNINNEVNLNKLNEVAETAVKYDDDILFKPDTSRIENDFKHRKDVRKTAHNKFYKCNKEKLGQVKKIACKSCSFKNKSIMISENSIKYCLVCSSIYDTDNCKYCIKKLKCSCKIAEEYICNECSIKLSDKKSIIEHLNECKVGG